jgi:spermidine synthase
LSSIHNNKLKSGNRIILFVTAMILYIISLVLHRDRKYILFILFVGITIIMNFFIGKVMFKASNPAIIADIDSEYSRIWIMNYNNEYKVLRVDTAIESYTDNKGNMGAKYLEYYDLFEYFNHSAKDTLIIGGAAYTYPTHYLNKFKDKNIDVVEIDSKMTELAKEYFNLKENSRLNIYHQDGRGYINKSDKKYDTILVDAFKGYNVPFELTTKEAFTNIKNMLNENGMVIVNVISALDGKDSGLIKAQYATFEEVFADVKLFAVSDKENKTSKQNLILIGFKTKESGYPSSSEYGEYLLNEITDFNTDYKAFTDDYAPVEKYM